MSEFERADANPHPTAPAAPSAAHAHPSAQPGSAERRGWLSLFNPLHLFSHGEENSPMAQAQHLMREQQYGQASLLYLKILEQEPEEPEALRGLSATLLRKGGRRNLQTALEYMEHALRAAPYNPANYLMTTLLYSRMGRPHEAGIERKKMAVARTLQKNPDNATANNSMGVILLRMNRHEEAIDCFRKAIAANPRYDRAHRNLAKTYFVLARREGAGPRRSELTRNAQLAVQQALQIATSAASLITEARVLVLLGDLPAAEERLTRAAKLEPKHPELTEGWRMIAKASAGESGSDAKNQATPA
jgi:tetratricopeptide (TPR) repeat protein